MPLPILYGLLIALGFRGLIKIFIGGGKDIINIHSNCHQEFLSFNENLNITKSKLKKLKTARKAVQNKIKAYFKNLEGYSTPMFYIQGSSQIGTIIRGKKDFCDFDVGIYFLKKPEYTFETIQLNIKRALLNHTSGKVRLLEKCVRIHYSGDFQIDMPIYFKDSNEAYYLGSKNSDWKLCDSKSFKSLVLNETKDNPQTIRLIRYFKAWADNHKYKLPSGLAFTIWTINYKKNDNRDDVALVQTAASILKNLNNNHWSSSYWQCIMPVEPKDNVIDNLTSDQKANFKYALEELIKNGVQALSAETKDQALKKWKRLFGSRFSI